MQLTQELQPDLLFLDIQMPGLNGFEVLNQTEHFPIVIFCTAFDNYALKAFETNALDYIVKPVKIERVRKSIEKLGSINQAHKKDQIIEALSNFIKQKPVEKITSIPVKIGDRMLFLKLADLSYFHAEEKYVSIIGKDGKKYLCDHSLKYLEEKLENQFIRVHRSYLINQSLIKEVGKYLGGKSFIRMDDYSLSKIITGRNYQENIKRFMSF